MSDDDKKKALKLAALATGFGVNLPALIDQEIKRSGCALNKKEEEKK